MFTGIVMAMGTVEKVERKDEVLDITIAAPFDDLSEGESVAINGACLTVVALRPGRFRVQAVVTTQDRTRLAQMREGGRVNLERALRASDRLGGHFVQGHVDGLAEVTAVRESKDSLLLDLRVPPDVAATTVLHGSIALDGVSLMVNAIPEPGLVQVSLIPFTRLHTTLGQLRGGDKVHVEGDMLGKMVAQFLKHGEGSSS
ncbi:MAG: riboflavin synthase [Gemmatimonadetes bacterium]|nr:riboflavin synthase [Gemmatimonadota bacterium]